jgi:hypothetical protein
VLIAAHVADERVTKSHRAKLAYVYVRQSSMNQVSVALREAQKAALDVVEVYPYINYIKYLLPG